MSHTPGPWHSALVSEKHWNVGVYDSGGNSLAVIKVTSALQGHRRDADGRLMAAAPELLSACLAYIADRAEAGCTADSAAVKQMRAAIAKAMGERS